ncbi:TonB-dependent receptor [Taibaiella chishuiensis]|nr:TonB-dependent receptor [Taibaiella chishuiensis]
MKKTFMLFGLLCSSALVFGQAGTIKGKIINNDGSPAANITISLENEDTDVNTITDEHGNFSIESDAGKYKMTVHAVGSATRTMTVEVGDDQTINVPAIRLKGNNTELNEVVVGAARQGYKADKVSSSLRLETPILETPQNIQVITNKVMADQQITSMGMGLLRNISGATQLEHWDSYVRVNMRGSRASAFRNGMNVLSTWGPLTEDMSMVDHVEFVKGPAGFMMSNGEPSGIYNVVTKKPTGVNRGEATLTLGSFDFYRAAVDLDGKLDKTGKVLYRLNLMGQTQNSFRDYQYNNRISIAPVITYKIDDKTSLTAEYNFQYARMSDVGSSYVFSPNGYGDLPRNFTTAESGLDPTIVKDHSLFLYLHHKINSDWKLTAQAAYLNYSQQGSSLWPNSLDAQGNMIRSVGIWDAANESKFGQVYLNGDIQTGPVHHRILAGLDLGDKEYMADWGQSHALDKEGTFFNIYKPVHGTPSNGYPVFDRSRSLRQRAGGNLINQSFAGLYVQDEIGFFENRLRLTLAGRYTYVKESSYGTVVDAKRFTPRIGLSASIDKNTTAYALFDQSFVPQSGLLRNGDKPKPITGNNIELGLKRDWMDGQWNTTLSVYRILKNNQLIADPDTTNNPNNIYSLQVGQSRAWGVEFDLRGEITRGLSLILNYAYTDSRITKDIVPANIDKLVPGFAKHVSNAWLSYRIPEGALKGLGFAGGFSYQKDRSTWSWDATNQKNLPDYFRLDGGVSWQNDRMTVAVNVFNILDKYLYSGAPYASFYYYQAEPPRNFRASIAYRF